MIPGNLKSVVDIGRGKGDIDNAISERNSKIRVLGVDRTQKVLKYVKTSVILTKLPNALRCFTKTKTTVKNRWLVYSKIRRSLLQTRIILLFLLRFALSGRI